MAVARPFRFAFAETKQFVFQVSPQFWLSTFAVYATGVIVSWHFRGPEATMSDIGASIIWGFLPVVMLALGLFLWSYIKAPFVFYVERREKLAAAEAQAKLDELTATLGKKLGFQLNQDQIDRLLSQITDTPLAYIKGTAAPPPPAPVPWVIARLEMHYSERHEQRPLTLENFSDEPAINVQISDVVAGSTSIHFDDIPLLSKGSPVFRTPHVTHYDGLQNSDLWKALEHIRMAGVTNEIAKGMLSGTNKKDVRGPTVLPLQISYGDRTFRRHVTHHAIYFGDLKLKIQVENPAAPPDWTDASGDAVDELFSRKPEDDEKDS